MHAFDWLIATMPVLLVVVVALRTHRHTRTVADFMAANRCAGRYLVCIARGVSVSGVISVVALCEYYYRAGFAINWWSLLTAPVSLFVAITGFVVVRFRETRALTLAQFLEMRYSRRFRVYAGALAFLGGVVNYGIFPAVGSRFFVYFLGFPTEVSFASVTVPTYVIVMAVYLSVTLFVTLAGGQLTIMVVDCLQGMISNLFSAVIMFTLIVMFPWRDICEAFATAPAGQSMFNPFDAARITDFNIWFVLVGLFAGIYGTMAWQGTQGYNACARDPHEAQMGSILGTLREDARVIFILLLAVCAFTYFNHPRFAGRAIHVEDALTAISNPQVREQMRVPVILRHMLPVGIKGMLAAVMVFSLVGCEDSYLHSWGSILVQDVILPLRKKPLNPEQHIRLLRWAITSVAIFAFIFSIVFRQTQYILMYLPLAGAIYMGGAGSVIIGGLYWKKATTPAAWAAMTLGLVLTASGMLLQQLPFATMAIRIAAPQARVVIVNGTRAAKDGDVWRAKFEFQKRDAWQSCKVTAVMQDRVVTNTLYYALGKPLGREPISPDADQPRLTVSPLDRTVLPLPTAGARGIFIALRSISGQILSFITKFSCIVIFVLVSLFTCRSDFNLDRMLHRGIYALDKEPVGKTCRETKWSLGGYLGFDEYFTRGDKAIALAVFAWSLLWSAVAVVGTVWNLMRPWPLAWWQSFWHLYGLVIPTTLGIITAVWFSCGGIRDLYDMFKRLRTMKRDERDDGRVLD